LLEHSWKPLFESFDFTRLLPSENERIEDDDLMEAYEMFGYVTWDDGLRGVPQGMEVIDGEVYELVE
jgi:hypothetical protein